MGSVRDQLYNRVECRVGLVGDRGVGKTALVNKFCGEEFIKVNVNLKFLLHSVTFYLLHLYHEESNLLLRNCPGKYASVIMPV